MFHLNPKHHLKFYSHVNFSVTKIVISDIKALPEFYSHVNFSVTKMGNRKRRRKKAFYSHVNFSVTKIEIHAQGNKGGFTVT